MLGLSPGLMREASFACFVSLYILGSMIQKTKRKTNPSWFSLRILRRGSDVSLSLNPSECDQCFLQNLRVGVVGREEECSSARTQSVMAPHVLPLLDQISEYVSSFPRYVTGKVCGLFYWCVQLFMVQVECVIRLERSIKITYMMSTTFYVYSVRPRISSLKGRQDHFQFAKGTSIGKS